MIYDLQLSIECIMILKDHHDINVDLGLELTFQPILPEKTWCQKVSKEYNFS